MHNTDGFFVAKLVKYDNVIPVDKEKSEEDLAIEKALEENRKAAEEREEVIAGKKEVGKKEVGKKEVGKKEKSGKKEVGKKEVGKKEVGKKEKSGKKEGEKRFGKKPRQDKPKQNKPRQEKPKQEKGTEGAANAKEMTPKEERKMVRNKKDGKKRFMMKQKKE